MANVQKEFEKFVDTIRLGTMDEEKVLRDKRDAVVNALRNGLKKSFEAKGEPTPTFQRFNQGSYSLKTGIKPEGGGNGYDIDVGIVFEVDPDDYKDDPVELKRWVRDALGNHTDDIRIKTPCVTVNYKAGYHVDLAIYAHKDGETKGELPLAWGKDRSAQQEWQTNHPSRLGDLIQETFPGSNDRHQFRRVLRALKRWRDRKYKSATSHAAPVGVGLTVAGLLGSTKFATYYDVQGKPNDRGALEAFVRSLLNAFQDSCWSKKDDAYGRRLVVELPFEPHKDVFERINNNNMKVLEERLQALLDDLVAAGATTSRKEACNCMIQQFGDDFPECKDDDSTQDSKKNSAVWVPSHTSGSKTF